MPLPKIDLPIYELKLVSHPTPIKFRPFLVKEEKILLMALQSEDEKNIMDSIKQVVNNCLFDDSVDIEKLPIFDLEYLFLNIRARSAGEEIDTVYMCRQPSKTMTEEGVEVDDICANLMSVKVNLLEIKPPISDLPSRIMLTDKIGIQMKFPTLKSFAPIKAMISAENVDAVFNIIYSCSEYVFDEDGVYYTAETSREEFDNFLNSLTQEQFDTITRFFEMLPKIKHDVKHTCEKCGYVHDLHMEGLNDFFT
jgi:hypothetical protein